MNTPTTPLGYPQEKDTVTPCAETGGNRERSKVYRMLMIVLLISFTGKLCVRFLEMQRADYWESGYALNYLIAQNIVQNGVYCLGDPAEPGNGCQAPRVPLYPFFIAMICWGTSNSALIFVICEGLISTLAVALIFCITQRLGPPSTALLSTILYAFYPYAFVHDTQLQENGLLNALSLVMVYWLLIAVEGKSVLAFLGAGMVAGLCILTRASHSAVTLALLGSVFWILRRQPVWACKAAMAFLLGAIFLVGPWVVRNKLLLGKLTLTSETGVALAAAHNDYLFKYYPYRDSIDVSFRLYQERMTGEKQKQLVDFGTDEIARERWFAKEAVAYMEGHVLQTIVEGFCKAAVNFAGVLSPLDTKFKNWVYAVSYWMLTLPGLYGIYLLRRTTYCKLLSSIVLAQIAVSFVFWAHTSHRSYLDALFAIPAGVGLAAALQVLRGKSKCL